MIHTAFTWHSTECVRERSRYAIPALPRAQLRPGALPQTAHGQCSDRSRLVSSFSTPGVRPHRSSDVGSTHVIHTSTAFNQAAGMRFYISRVRLHLQHHSTAGPTSRCECFKSSSLCVQHAFSAAPTVVQHARFIHTAFTWRSTECAHERSRYALPALLRAQLRPGAPPQAYTRSVQRSQPLGKLISTHRARLHRSSDGGSASAIHSYGIHMAFNRVRS